MNEHSVMATKTFKDYFINIYILFAYKLFVRLAAMCAEAIRVGVSTGPTGNWPTVQCLTKPIYDKMYTFSL